MRKRLIYMVSVGMLISSLAMTVHSAEVKRIKPGDIKQVPQVVQTPEKIDTGNIQRPKPDLTLINPRVIPANPTVNDQIHLTATINNIGDIPAGSFKTGVRIGGESRPKPAASVGHLDVTTPQSQQYVVSRLWNTSRPGKYVVEFFVDVNDDVKEHNEHNNSIKMTITVGP